MAARRGSTEENLTPHIQMDMIRRKPVRWLGDSLNRVREFPRAARHQAGTELRHVQQGEPPADWKPMPTVGPGVNEIRVHAGNEYRVLYVAKFAETIYVLHAFEKKTRKTPKSDIDLTAKRYRGLMAERRRR